MTQRVLLVDDDADVRRTYSDILESAGYAITAVATGEQALDMIDGVRPNVIVLDIDLPGLDGIEVARELSERRIPLFVISCRTDSERKAWAKLNGCLRYIEKPFVPTDRLDAIVTVQPFIRSSVHRFLRLPVPALEGLCERARAAGGERMRARTGSPERANG
ncbi:MAG: response regulator [Planctomycetes bacterium]|nr:response regulator [Planctomycetota bacterium]